MTALTSPEIDVLHDLYHGLSRSKISANRNLSASAVKVIINSTYEKLDAYNIVDVIRAAVERGLV